MSYQVLARKWRPRSFDELVGQAHVLRALVNALDNDRLHHAYLFTGTRGVGKTTLARILAKSLNCETGVGSHPCGECSACREIDEGRFVDLIEVDAASRTKVDETRELLENVQYAPTRGRYKVYLIDEVHMFSNHSFNALLKTLEEPPPHVKFLLATTDPQKLPVTILSRCLQFNLKRLPPEQIRDYLEQILEREGIKAEPGALRELARAADGSMRDGLSLLDQAIAYGGGEVREAEVRTMLGTIEREFVYDLVRALAAGDGRALLARVGDAAERSTDFAALLAELLSVLQRIAVHQALPGEGLDEYADASEAIAELAAALSPEDVQLYYQIGLIGRRDLPLAPDPRGGLEMILLRMLSFRPAAAAETPAAAAPARPARPGTSGAAGQASAPAAPTAAVSGSGTAQPVSDDWPGLIAAMGLRGLAGQLAENCTLVSCGDNRVQLHLDPAHQHLLTPALQAKLAEALNRCLGREVRLEIDSGSGTPPPAETPAQQQARRSQERQQAAESAIAGDETVRALQDTFNARVQPDSIRPLDDA
ncbi:MAG: DNA polymerase III subunit gamma/tau [Gammaproteobacteria bacterium]|nr:DNA polymerase III subunit gamma/tau [Gammaproteobacteria bacterium]